MRAVDNTTSSSGLKVGSGGAELVQVLHDALVRVVQVAHAQHGGAVVCLVRPRAGIARMPGMMPVRMVAGMVAGMMLGMVAGMMPGMMPGM
jgi:hypothetical protein